jgi:UPF0042 nucleotide-binding protein
VLGILEDSGLVALDNVPFQLLGPLLEFESKTSMGKARIAVGMDSRHPEFHLNFAPMLDQLDHQGVAAFVIYLECEDKALIRRYSETRRPHIYAGEGGIAFGIAREREMLQAVKDRATIVIDTSNLTLGQLRQRVADILPKCHSPKTQLKIISFGFKHGLPAEADMLYDARFLPNPFYVPQLRSLSGEDAQIHEYLSGFKEFNEFVDRMESWIEWSWPFVLEESKAYHNVAIGCTGGRHRSVALAEKLAARLSGQIENIFVHHRDLKH